MTESLSIPRAWCVELKRLVTPQDILRYRAQHPDQQLSFLCPECDLPITFHPRVGGIRAQAYFIRKTGQYHQSCIAKINHEHCPAKEIILLQTFEDVFVRAEATNKELAGLLKQLSVLCITLRKEVFDNCGSKELQLLQLLAQQILQIKIPNSFAQISTTYLKLRRKLQGY